MVRQVRGGRGPGKRRCGGPVGAEADAAGKQYRAFVESAVSSRKPSTTLIAPTSLVFAVWRINT